MSTHKWVTVYCGCVGVGTPSAPMKPHATIYSKEFHANDIRSDKTVCSGSGKYSFLVDLFVSDAEITQMKRDGNIEFIAIMPPSFETVLSDFLVQSDIDRIVTEMEQRGYTATIDLSMTFRDLYRILLEEIHFRSMFGKKYFNATIDESLNRGQFNRIKRDFRKKGFVVDNAKWTPSITPRQVIVIANEQRKKDKKIKEKFKTHVDHPHVYRGAR